MTATQHLSWSVSPKVGSISGLYLRPSRARGLMVLGHGAGADMHHIFMAGMAAALADVQIATLRYQFPYTEAGRKRPDRPPVLYAAARSAVLQGYGRAPTLPLIVGGKSMGGRIVAELYGQEGVALPQPRAFCFLGYPLHAAGKPSTARAACLHSLKAPMYFLQGSKDRLASLPLMQQTCRALGPRATLFVVDDADHGFNVPKRRRLAAAEVHKILAEQILSALD